MRQLATFNKHGRSRKCISGVDRFTCAFNVPIFNSLPRDYPKAGARK